MPGLGFRDGSNAHNGREQMLIVRARLKMSHLSTTPQELFLKFETYLTIVAAFPAMLLPDMELILDVSRPLAPK